MLLLYLVHILTSTIFVVDSSFLISKPQIRKQQNSNRICYAVTTEPYYLKMLVIGKPWHIYYTWNMQLKEMCGKTIFKAPGNMNQIVRFLKAKFDALIEEPNWTKAELLIYMGESKQMILFRDSSGIHGQFDGLPYYRRDDFPYELPLRKPYKMNMKILERGKYLLLSDCTTGMTSLLLHPKGRPKRVAINAFAAKFDFGIPYPACINEPDPVVKNITIEIETVATEATTKKISKYDW